MPQTSISVRVPFSDVDSSGRIHFTAMLRYMEIAEHELVRSIGFSRATTLLDIGFPRVHVARDYRRAVSFDDELTIEARVTRVGRSSWTIAFTARSKDEEGGVRASGEVVAEGEMTIVAMDRMTQRARFLPDEFRRALADE